ncbi:MAG: DUF4349 domain-containing protein [Saprospiraceae bacterium]
MQNSFKKRFWKYSAWLGGLFFVMLAFRLIYGYASTEALGSELNDLSNYFGSVENLRKNYASEKSSVSTDVGQQASVASGQKYEKTASVKSTSGQFETAGNQVKSKTQQFAGVIQYEQNTGNAGNRELHLLIGINPEKFDSFYVVIQQIGEVQSKEVTKIDKTNEYRQLNAKKASLEKILNSLNELKTRSGAISDHVSLHDKILEIETQLQELGVELGNFDTENEFCTVRFSLYEGATTPKISFMHRLKVALEWTIEYYSILMISLLCMSAFALVLLLLLEKLNILKTIVNKLDE